MDKFYLEYEKKTVQGETPLQPPSPSLWCFENEMSLEMDQFSVPIYVNTKIFENKAENAWFELFDL